MTRAWFRLRTERKSTSWKRSSNEYLFPFFFLLNGEHQYLINNNKNAEASSGFQTAFDEKKEKKGKEGLLSLKERTERKYIRRKERSSLKIPCQRDRRGGTP